MKRHQRTGGERRTASPVPNRRAAGELEDEVLAALWSDTEPMTAAQVHAMLGDDLAYTTVLTILSRLFAKGLAERAKIGRAYAYRPTVDAADRAADQMRQLLERRSNHEAVLARFVENLSAADERLLRRLVRGG